MSPRRGLALAAVAALPLSTLAAFTATAAGSDESIPQPAATSFHRLATYPVFQNVPDGVDPADPTVAEISSVSEDGETVVYTDAAGKRAGFLDISDPTDPVGAGSIDLAAEGHADDQPTSVSVVGDHLLVVVDSSGGDFTHPSGRLDVYRLEDRGDAEPIRSIDLGGQPDSIAVSDDQRFAAIAMENQRDEDLAPEGGEEGDLPQAPSGFVQVIDLADPAAPASWTNRRIDLPASELAGMDTPEDAEPEYVDINADNQLALSLQENNGIVVIDLPSGRIERAFSAGNAHVEGVDTEDDGLFDATGTIDAPREPDSLQWVGEDLVATANEGDWKGGTRGWTVFRASTGEVVWDAGSSFEQIATRHGLHNEDRAAKKGVEPEGLAFDTVGGVPYAFVGSERSNFVAVYDMTDPTRPVFRQALPTTNGPEGLLPVPGRDLLVVSSEEDEAEDGIRASVALFELGAGPAAFPSVLSADDESGQPVGWGALGALSQDPADPGHLWAASDAAYATGRIHHLDVSRSPAMIEDVIEVTRRDGASAEVDIEGLHAREDGGFWIASEGATGPENRVHQLDGNGRIIRSIRLPEKVAERLGKQGLEGVTATGSGRKERVYVALQRELDGEKFARIGRYDVGRDRWTWFGYRLDETSVEGDWTGLSELTMVDHRTLAVIERDKLNGPQAALKSVHTVQVPASSSPRVRVLRKDLAHDVLPDLRALNGWTQEKLEGLGITGSGRVFVVTDNDGLEDATGETQLVELGNRREVFPTAGSPRGPARR